MLSIARPQFGMVQNCGRCDKCIAQFETVTLVILPEIITGLAACFCVNGSAEQRTKEVVEHVMFARACTCPKFRGTYWRVQDKTVGLA